LERFWSYVLSDPATGCSNWQGALDINGYGHAYLPGFSGQRAAHRAMWHMLLGPIPKGMELDHLCRNRACVRLDHLELVSRAENNRRMLKVQADLFLAKLLRLLWKLD